MSFPDDVHVRKVRTALKQARSENCRMVAAAVGGHLSKLGRGGHGGEGLDAARDAVRDASLRLLNGLHRRTDVSVERQDALLSVDRLETVLTPTRVHHPEVTDVPRQRRGMLSPRRLLGSLVRRDGRPL